MDYYNRNKKFNYVATFISFVAMIVLVVISVCLK